METDNINCQSPKKQYPCLDWDIVNSCGETSLSDCANFICQLVTKFNGVTRSFSEVLSELNKTKEKLIKLEEYSKRLENCQKCVSLQKRLDNQISNMQTLAKVFGQIYDDNKEKSKSKLEKVQDMVTQMIDENDLVRYEHDKKATIIYGKRRLKIPENCEKENSEDENVIPMKCEPSCYETPKKKIRLKQKLSPGAEKDVESVKVECETSPILGKNRQKSNSNRSQDKKLPLGNLSNRLDASDTFIICSPKKGSEYGVDDVDESSPSLIGNPSDDEKKPSSQLSNKSSHADVPLVNDAPLLENASFTKDVPLLEDKQEANESKRDSLSLLQKHLPTRKKNNESLSHHSKCKKVKSSKKLKQARLSFSNMKLKEPSDLSLQESFCGGLRTFSTNDDLIKTDEKEMIKIAVQLSLNDSLKNKVNEDEDIIDASPSYQQKPAVKKKHRKLKKENVTTTVGDECITISDDDKTAMAQGKRASTSPLKKSNSTKVTEKSTTKANDFEFPLLSGCGDGIDKSLKQQSSPMKSIKKSSPVKDASYIYKEAVVRKKSDKMALPGWSCKKCKDFYEAAFKGDENMIREKMNECSRHRGKFNPERVDTPRGFWDLNMPPTQDTEAFNKRNNRD